MIGLIVAKPTTPSLKLALSVLPALLLRNGALPSGYGLTLSPLAM